MLSKSESYLTTKRRAPAIKAPSEDKEQQTLARWLDASGVLWCHVPNGGHRDVRVATKLRLHGVKPGVPDVLIFERVRAHPECIGVAIELKRSDSRCKPTPEQVAWIDALWERGWYATVCHGAAEAICLLVKIGLCHPS